MKWILTAATVLCFSPHAFGFDSSTSQVYTGATSYVAAVQNGSSCPSGSQLIKNANPQGLTAHCVTTALTSDEAEDADASSLATTAISDCAHALTLVDQDNCFIQDVTAFDVDGNFAVIGHKYGHRNSADQAFTVITKNIKRDVRGLLEVYCGSGGQTSWMFDQVSGDPRLCGSGYCFNTFGSGNSCATYCDGLVTTNCGGGACDLTGVSCATDCSTFSSDATCNQDCADVKVASGCFTRD